MPRKRSRKVRAFPLDQDSIHIGQFVTILGAIRRIPRDLISSMPEGSPVRLYHQPTPSCQSIERLIGHPMRVYAINGPLILVAVLGEDLTPRAYGTFDIRRVRFLPLSNHFLRAFVALNGRLNDDQQQPNPALTPSPPGARPPAPDEEQILRLILPKVAFPNPNRPEEPPSPAPAA